MNAPALNLVTPSGNSAFSVPVQTPLILLVDDDRIMRTVISQSLNKHGYRVMEAERGEQALTMLVQEGARIDAVVLDREMPAMNGLEVVERMKAERQLAGIPVIMLTGSGEQEKIQEGINAGVFYYLVKPTEEVLLFSVIDSALRERQQKRALLSELNRHGQALKAMQSCHIDIRTLAQSEDTACFLASCFPDAERVVAGLLELLTNAIEHGNLGITYAEKAQLLKENRWREEVDLRAQLPENKNKVVQVRYQHSADGYIVQITDAGAGFDWQRFWRIDLARAKASHGRGIARARLMAFDRLSYNEVGNQVTAMVSAEPLAIADYPW
jgi:CheY-like chemotaxis protein/anti-sigma regulatory factor (Ser/Thr protein kinase)